MRALYANEKKETMEITAVLKDAFTALVEKLGNIGGNKPRSELDDGDFVFADERKFPVVSKEDVSDAVSSWGRYKGKHTFAEFKARLISLCKRKGFVQELPETWGVKETGGISMYKQEDGSWRWVTISSTGFMDRDEEIVSSTALEKAAALNQEGDDAYGYLTYWHVPRLRVGKCDARFVEGVCLVETGTWFDDALSESLRKSVEFSPELWGVSIEFMGDLLTATENEEIKGKTVKRVWNDIRLGDRSILPAWRASNTLARIESQGGAAVMREEKRNFLREVAGEELAERVAQGVDAINSLVDADDSVVKEETVAETVEPAATEDTPVEAVVTEAEQPADSGIDPAVKAIAEAVQPLNALREFAATLDEAKQKELAAIIIALDEAIGDEEPGPADETPADSTGYDETANDETAKETTEPAEKTAEESAVDKERAEAFTDLTEQVSVLKEQLSGVQGILEELRTAVLRQKQEDLPRGVLQRASEADDNLVTTAKDVADAQAKVADDGTDPVVGMTQSILKILGGA